MLGAGASPLLGTLCAVGVSQESGWCFGQPRLDAGEDEGHGQLPVRRVAGERVEPFLELGERDPVEQFYEGKFPCQYREVSEPRKPATNVL